jgi:hypothetical protein
MYKEMLFPANSPLPRFVLFRETAINGKDQKQGAYLKAGERRSGQAL